MADHNTTRALAAAVVVLLLVVSCQHERARSRSEIARVTAVATRLERERDSIQAFVTANRRVVDELEAERDSREAELVRVRDRVDGLERSRHETTLSVRRLRRSSELQARLEQAFPDLAATNWGLTTIPFEPGDTLGIEYFVIPAWFTETFIIDHENAESWRAQRDELLVADSLRGRVAALTDSIAKLHAWNALAMQTGYDNASAQCSDLTTRYIGELRKPRFSVGSTVGFCLGAAGAGAVIATLVNR